VDSEDVAKALQAARASLSTLPNDDAQSLIAPVLQAIAEAERALRNPSAHPSSAAGQSERERELERKLRAHDEFSSMLSHELRNLLAPIVIEAEYLLQAARHSENSALPVDWLGARLEGFCRRLRKFVDLFNRIMDASRVTSGRMNLELEQVDLSEIVRDVCAGFEREATSARSSLRVDVPSSVTGLWDRQRLEQICTNLVSNAVRYGAGHPIEVYVRAEPQWAELLVRDHGIGIAAGDQQRIFERFERAGQGRNTGGFGIGLWIVRENCRAMGGSVEVQSGVGMGSTFTVRLPRG
jgi:signal transduction histidine kinase